MITQSYKCFAARKQETRPYVIRLPKPCFWGIQGFIGSLTPKAFVGDLFFK